MTPQNFWDPKSGREFHYNRPDIAMNSSWWHGEPVSHIAPRDSSKANIYVDVGNCRACWHHYCQPYVVSGPLQQHFGAIS
jgi:hypothetical protein